MYHVNTNQNRHFVSKGWGYEDWLDNNPLYCGKVLYVHKNKKLSLHYHIKKTETFFCLEGHVELSVYENPEHDQFFKSWGDFYSSTHRHRYEVHTLEAGNTFKIPSGMRHTVKGLINSKLVEISTEHFDEDSYRILKGD